MENVFSDNKLSEQINFKWIDKKKFSYEDIKIIKMTHPKSLNDKRIVIIQKNGSKYKNFLYFFIKRDYSQNYLAIFLQIRKICQEKKIEFVVERV